ncbi:hypothetical protein JHK87_033428 [Glycine soja]|nr:hypothetical protein JHK87_033428 [Glycine soja]
MVVVSASFWHGSGTRPRGNQIEPAPTLTDKNCVDRVRVLPDNPKLGRGQLSVLTPHIAKPLAGKKLCKRTLKHVHRGLQGEREDSGPLDGCCDLGEMMGAAGVTNLEE